jgi:hypothetical protein
MATTNGNIVIVTSVEDFIRLVQHPASISGFFDGKVGQVLFGTVSAAQAARREI